MGCGWFAVVAVLAAGCAISAPRDRNTDPTCGDGVLDPAEVCDDDNTSSGDGCSADCRSDETCGNGVVDLEICDDGNEIGGDGCAADCLSDESCGNGIVDVPEICDDGNLVGGDSCDGNCGILTVELCGNGIDDDSIGGDASCPPNDLPGGAIDISAGGTFAVDITAAHDDGTGSCGQPGGRDAFYTFTLAATRVVYFDTFGSDHDTVVHIYAGACTNVGGQLICADNACATTRSQAGLELAAGSYCLVVDQSDGAQTTGTSSLTFRTGHSGTPIAVGAGTQSGNTLTAINETTNTCTPSVAGDVGYFFTSCPGQTFTVDADICASNYDSSLSLRSASNQTVDVACDDDTCAPGGGARLVTSTITGPDLHWLIVDGFDQNTGTYTLVYSIQ